MDHVRGESEEKVVLCLGREWWRSAFVMLSILSTPQNLKLNLKNLKFLHTMKSLSTRFAQFS